MSKINYILKNPLTYKVCVDIFLLLLIATIIFLLFETVLPGIITAYVSPFILFVVLFITVGFITLIAHHIGAVAQTTKHRKIITIFASLSFAIIIGIAGFRYGFFMGSTVVIFSFTLFILLYSLLRDMLKS